jgi:hypothetical protein
VSTLVLPYTAVANQVAPSASYNANDAAIVAWANGNIDNTNIGSAGIFASQIKPTTGTQATFGATATGVGYKFLANDATAVPLTVSGVSGQSADIFDVTLTSGGNKVFSVVSSGVTGTTALAALSLPPAAVAGDFVVQRTASAGAAWFGGASQRGSIDFGTSTAGQFTISAATAFNGFISTVGIVYGSYTATPSAPGTSSTGDGVFQRTASTGALFLGGATDFMAMDYSLNTSGHVTMLLKSGAGAPLNCGAITNISDASLKENVVPISGALAILEQLKPSSFTWINDGQPDYGFLAQDVEAVLPDAVSDVGELKGINYAAITPWNTAAIVQIATMLKAAGIAGF